MASKSGGKIPVHGWKKDVYLSYRAKDANCLKFTSLLNDSLKDQSVSVSIDLDHGKLSKEEDGAPIPSTASEAIQGSAISIAVFSRNYIHSAWCLRELDKMMECRRRMGQVIVPVFYDVVPRDLRMQTGHFGEAFRRHMGRFSEEEVNGWRAALTDAVKIGGHFYHDFRSTESETINRIVEHVTSLLKSGLIFKEHMVGVESRVQVVVQKLNLERSDNVLMIGIWGMVGIGKTTIAKALYQQVGLNFEGRKFLANIRGGWERNGKVLLQKELLSCVDKTKTSTIQSIEYGRLILSETLCQKRVFLVLDDVSRIDQLEALCGDRKWFAPGSRIIITTRDRKVLKMHGVDEVYRVKEMDYNESIELFSWRAFKKSTPENNFAQITERAVEYCDRLPLALRIIGSLLCEKSIEDCENILENVEIHPQQDLQNILKTSFDQLSDNMMKEIFLEIACFFVGMDKNDVIETLNVSEYNARVGVPALQDQSLVTVDENKKLQMHKLLQVMGKEIVLGASKIKSKQKTYDVFLSFRGKDTRATFTSHLHESLVTSGISVFKDDVTLQRGERTSVSLLKAIGESRISVVVFSENYAESRWCMQELENIMMCYSTEAKKVVPIFYGVDPSEVRNQTGMFGDAFKRLTKRISLNEGQMRTWRTALRLVGSLSGIVVLNSSNESDDVKKVVEDVTRLLDKTELFVAEHPVGVDFHVEHVTELLKSKQQYSKDVVLLGIWGMGGIGKTTIAKAVYNKVGRGFDNRSFLIDIKEVWEQKNIVSLQQRLLSDVFKTTKIVIRDIESGKSELMNRLRHIKVLLVLDDINRADQLNALFGSAKWVGPGSCVIITTRNEHLLKGRGVDPIIYRLGEMSERDALELFSWHAFKQSSPKEPFVKLSRDVVKYSCGLPLALEVLGSYLIDREIPEWKSVLDKIKRIPPQEIQKKLRISFDGLSEENEKEIFLDIACFFIGMDRSDVIKILNSCRLFAEIGITVLKERSLVTVNNKNKLGMHGLLRDMGRQIVCEKSSNPEDRSRLWDSEEVLDMLRKSKGTKAVHGLALKLPRTSNAIIPPLDTKDFKKMEKLRLLQLAGVNLRGDFKYLSRDLRWMNCHGFPSRDTPTGDYQEKLVAIEFEHSNLEHFAWNKSKVLSNLKILNLSHSHHLRETPDFSCLPILEKLILKNCKKLSSVSHTIGLLREILVINLKNCTSLSVLPRSIYKLKSLETLILSGCLNIEKLEEDLAQMESLTTLKAENTAITVVPTAVLLSESLVYISLCGFTGLKRDVLPSIIWSKNPPTEAFSSRVQGSLSMSSPVLLDALLRDLWKKYKTGDLYKEVESRPTTSTPIGCHKQGNISGSNNSFNNYLWIPMGKNIDIISEKLGTTWPGEYCLPHDDKNSNWFIFNGESSSLTFEVPQVNGCNLKSMMFRIVYSSFPNIIASSEGLILKNLSIMTQTTTLVYEGYRLTSLNDEDWQRVVSILSADNKVEIAVVSEFGIFVKEIVAYLVYDEPIDQNKHAIVSKNASGGGDADNVARDENSVVYGDGDILAFLEENAFRADNTATTNENENVISVTSDEDMVIINLNNTVSGVGDTATTNENTNDSRVSGMAADKTEDADDVALSSIDDKASLSGMATASSFWGDEKAFPVAVSSASGPIEALRNSGNKGTKIKENQQLQLSSEGASVRTWAAPTEGENAEHSLVPMSTSSHGEVPIPQGITLEVPLGSMANSYPPTRSELGLNRAAPLPWPQTPTSQSVPVIVEIEDDNEDDDDLLAEIHQALSSETSKKLPSFSTQNVKQPPSQLAHVVENHNAASPIPLPQLRSIVEKLKIPFDELISKGTESQLLAATAENTLALTNLSIEVAGKVRDLLTFSDTTNRFYAHFKATKAKEAKVQQELGELAAAKETKKAYRDKLSNHLSFLDQGYIQLVEEEETLEKKLQEVKKQKLTFQGLKRKAEARISERESEMVRLDEDALAKKEELTTIARELKTIEGTRDRMVDLQQSLKDYFDEFL